MLVLGICFIIIVTCYIYDFVQEEKKKDKNIKAKKRMRKNRARFNIDIK